MNGSRVFRCVLLVAGVVGALVGSESRVVASTVSFAFSGQITDVSDFRGVIGDTVRVGDPFSGFYTFDSESPDLSPAQHAGQYRLLDLLGAVGSNDFARNGGSGGLIQIFAPTPNGGLTGYSVFTRLDFLGQEVRASISITDQTKTLFPTDELPIVPPLFENATRAIFVLGASSKDFSLSGELQSLTLVPEPTSAFLLGLAGLALVRRRRRRKLP